MLVLKHIAAGTGEPFPSDLFTALVAVDARLTYLVLEAAGQFEPHTATAADLVDAVLKDPTLADRIVITSYVLPVGGAKDAVLAQKVALRDVNAHSIVNATTRLTFAGKLAVTAATLVFGGIAPYPWRARKTEAAMAGKTLTLDRPARSRRSSRRKSATNWIAGPGGWRRLRTRASPGSTARSSPCRSSTRRSSTRWCARAARCRPA